MSEEKPIREGTAAATRRLGLSRYAMWRTRRTDPSFPRPIYVRQRCIWNVAELEEWIAKQPRTLNKTPPAPSTLRRRKSGRYGKERTARRVAS